MDFQIPFPQRPHLLISVNEHSDPSAMSVSADLGADAYREGKGFVLVMIKREKRRWEKQREKDMNVERIQNERVCSATWRAQTFLGVFEESETSRFFSFSFFRNCLVLEFPAGLLCVLKAAPPQQLVERKIFCHLGKQHFCNESRLQAPERETAHRGGPEEKNSKRVCVS